VRARFSLIEDVSEVGQEIVIDVGKRGNLEYNKKQAYVHIFNQLKISMTQSNLKVLVSG